MSSGCGERERVGSMTMSGAFALVVAFCLTTGCLEERKEVAESALPGPSAADVALPDTAIADTTPAGCVAPASRLSIDHVVVAVRDLPWITRRLTSLGYRVKPGRIHANGLVNAHLKFRDGTSLELMSVGDSVAGEVAEGYARFLTSGDGGAFVAFHASLDEVNAAARRAGIPVRRIEDGGIRYAVLDASALDAVFFLRHLDADDPDSLLTHVGGARGISRVWLEAAPSFADVLRSMGAVPCGTSLFTEGRFGELWAVRNGEVVVLAPGTGRPRVSGVRVAVEPSGASSSLPSLLGLWLDFRPQAGPRPPVVP